MDEIKNKIQSRINELNTRINQLHYSKKNVKFYYVDKIKELKEDIKDLEAQYIYHYNYTESDTVDLHGATRYFIDYYFDDLIFYKFEFFSKVKVITGKGTRVLFNHLKKHLISNQYKFSIKENNFDIKKM